MSNKTKKEIASTIDKILVDLDHLGADKDARFSSVYYSLGKIEGLLGIEGEEHE